MGSKRVTNAIIIFVALYCFNGDVNNYISKFSVGRENRENVEEKPYVCVIGAGYSGLGTARYLQEHGLNFTVYEATRHIGGTWRFDPHVGMDEDGVPVFTSMYKYLRTNTPIQTMEYTGYPFPEGTPSYPTATCFYKYLKSFAQHFQLIQNIQFQSLVTSVKWVNGHWSITYTKTDDKTVHTDVCGFVVVASGMLNKPKWPKYEGQELFSGKIIHSHDYKEPEAFKGRRVLIVGAGPSGLDLAMHLSNVTSKLIHSHHLVYNQPEFPKNYVKKPDIDYITTNGVKFNDGSFEEVDNIIFCTGFDYDHPFLEESTGVTATEKYILPLYHDLVNIRHPSMVFVGTSKKVINRLLDAQAEYAAALAAQNFKLPSQEKMLRAWLDHVRVLQAKKLKFIDVNVIGDDMDQYFANLTQEAGVVRVPPVLSTVRDFNAKIRLDDLFNYREYDFHIIDDTHFDRSYNPGRGNMCPISV